VSNSSIKIASAVISLETIKIVRIIVYMERTILLRDLKFCWLQI